MGTLLDCCGFESGYSSVNLVDTEFSAYGFTAGSGFTDGNTWLVTPLSLWSFSTSTGGTVGSVSWGERDWGSDQATICIHTRWRFDATPSTLNSFCTILDSANNPIIDLRVDANGKFALYNYGNTTTYTSTSRAVRAAVWYRIEVKLYANGASGTLDWKTDGVLEPGINGINGINTLPSGLPRKYRVGVTQGQANIGWREVDDVIVSTDWVGPAIVKRLLPRTTEAGNWTVDQAGRASWEMMQDTQFGNSDSWYIKSSTANQEERWTLTRVGETAAALVPMGLTIGLRLRRTSANAAGVSVCIRSGSTDGPVTSMDAGGTSYKSMWTPVLATDPATSVAWTLAGMNAAQLKVLHDASSYEVAICSCIVQAALQFAGSGLAAASLHGTRAYSELARWGQTLNGTHTSNPARGRLGHRVTR